ncbi:MAG: hypothetical protein FJ098_04585, partial [Deltaproteobacteria bacterium]|nr:hypothetical protein [Deltaproteobacteria bacterium]
GGTGDTRDFFEVHIDGAGTVTLGSDAELDNDLNVHGGKLLIPSYSLHVANAGADGSAASVIDAGAEVEMTGTAFFRSSLNNQGPLTISGTLDLQGGKFDTHNNLTLAATGRIDQSGGLLGVGDTFTINSGAVFNGTGGRVRGKSDGDDYAPTVTNNGTSTVFWDFLGDGGTSANPAVIGGSQPITVKGTVIRDSGYVNLGASTLKVEGHWDNNVGTAAFNAGTGTVEFTGAGASTISGNTNFYHLKCVTAGKALTHEAGSTTGVQGTYTLTGASGSNIVLRSSTSGSKWFLNNSSGSNAVTRVDVKDSDASSGGTIDARNNCVDSTGNLNWSFGVGACKACAADIWCATGLSCDPVPGGGTKLCHATAANCVEGAVDSCSDTGKTAGTTASSCADTGAAVEAAVSWVCQADQTWSQVACTANQYCSAGACTACTTTQCPTFLSCRDGSPCCDLDSECATTDYCDDGTSGSPRFVCETAPVLARGTLNTATYACTTDQDIGWRTDVGGSAPADACVLYDANDAELPNLFDIWVNKAKAIDNPNLSGDGVWSPYLYHAVSPAAGVNVWEFDSLACGDGHWFRNVMMGYVRSEAGATDGGASTSCCDASTDCVDDYVAGSTWGCYNSGACWNTGSTASTNEYCNAGTWVDNDNSQAACDACVATLRWNLGGEVAATSCCGDDAAEFRRTEDSHSSTLAWDDNQVACCDAATDCLFAATCYAAQAAGTSPQVTTSGSDQYAHCYNASGSGQWLECDESDWMDYWCGNVCGPKLGVSNPRSPTNTPNPAWNATRAGESGVGEYPDVGSTYGCCGDDANEIYRTAQGFLADTTDTCCTLATKCVHGELCYTTGQSLGNRLCSSGSWTCTAPTTFTVASSSLAALNHERAAVTVTLGPSGTYVLEQTVPASVSYGTVTGTSYTVTGLLDNTRYCFRAGCAGGPWATEQCLITPDRTFPSVPDLTVADVSGVSSVSLKEDDKGLLGLVAYMPFEEGAGAVAENWAAAATDATLSAPAWGAGVDGRAASALVAAGGTSGSFPAQASLNPAVYTVTAWIYPQVGSYWALAVGKDGGVGGRNYCMYLGNNDNGGNTYVHHRFMANGNWNDGHDSSWSIPKNQWTHVAIWNDGNIARIYLNGVLDTEYDFAGALTVVNVPVTFANSMVGRLDEVRIYNRNLTQREIVDLMQSKVSRRAVQRHVAAGGGRSVSSCAAKGWAVDSAASADSLTVCGGTPGCATGKTFLQARSACEVAGARLCSLTELQAGEVQGAGGCSYDATLLWTSTPCASGYMVQMGNPANGGRACVSAASTAAFLCCADTAPLNDSWTPVRSETGCEALAAAHGGDWGNLTMNGSPSGVCGETDNGLGGCSAGVAWETARAKCTAAGARLCTHTELGASEAKGTGCSYEANQVWSSTPCGPGSFWVRKGDAATTWDQCVAETATSGTYSTLAARCCADSDPASAEDYRFLYTDLFSYADASDAAGPLPPNAVTVTAVSTNQVNVSWSGAADEGTTYYLFSRALDEAGNRSNLVPFGGFEEGMHGCDVPSSYGTYAVVNESCHTGSGCLKFTGGAGECEYLVDKDMIQAGKTYRLSAWVKEVGTTNCDQYLHARWWLADGTNVITVGGDVATDGAWHYTEVFITLPGDRGAVTGFSFYLAYDADCSGTRTIDDVEVVEIDRGTVVRGLKDSYVDETTGAAGGTDSGWTTAGSYADTGLSVNTQYCYRIQARDNGDTAGAWTATSCATTWQCSVHGDCAAGNYCTAGHLC